MNLPLFNYNRDPEILLHRASEKVIPGLCWPLKGAKGYVLIELAAPINVSRVEYLHAPARLEPAALRKSAPKSFEAWVRDTKRL